MMRVWDYFMRRKGLLLLALMTFVVSGIISYQALRSNSALDPEPQYLSISGLRQPDDETLIDKEAASVDEEGSSIDEPLAPNSDPEAELDSDLDSKPDLGPEDSELDPTAGIDSELEEIPESYLEPEFYSESELAFSIVLDARDVVLLDFPTEHLPSEPYVAEQPTEVPNVPLTSTPASKPTNPTYILLLSFSGIIIVAMGSYFVEQHFRR